MSKVRFLLLVALLPHGLLAQEIASIKVTGNDAVMTVDSTRPMIAIANALAKKYGVLISAEEPTSISALDMEDMDRAFPNAPHKKNYPVPRRRQFEVHFQVGSNGQLGGDVYRVLQEAVRIANEQMPFAYRLDVDEEFFTFVPTKTRDATGSIVDATPLLDRKVTIPAGKRSIRDSVELMTKSLSEQTGLHVGLTDNAMTGIPWGTPIGPFEAKDEPARKVLERLIRLDQQNDDHDAGCHYWTMSCDNTWCLIFLEKPLDSQCQKPGWRTRADSAGWEVDDGSGQWRAMEKAVEKR